GGPGPHCVVNENGFGPGPGANGFPAKSVPSIVIVNIVHNGNPGPVGDGESWSTSEAFDHTASSWKAGLRTHIVVCWSMDSEKMIVIVAYGGTPVAPSPGSTLTITGAIESIENEFALAPHAELLSGATAQTRASACTVLTYWTVHAYEAFPTGYVPEVITF